MGRTYSVPRNVKGESRILYIFTMRSFISTVAGTLVGFMFMLLLTALGFPLAGWIVLGVLGLLGFGIGTLTIPDSKIVGNMRKAGGERLGDIIFRTITFIKRKKIYVYRGGNK